MRQIGDVAGQAMIANNLGGVLKLQDNVDEAITQFQRSLAIFERLGSRYATGVLHMNLGATYLQGFSLAQPMTGGHTAAWFAAHSEDTR